jgi:hypothetical protein
MIPDLGHQVRGGITFLMSSKGNIKDGPPRGNLNKSRFLDAKQSDSELSRWESGMSQEVVQ